MTFEPAPHGMSWLGVYLPAEDGLSVSTPASMRSPPSVRPTTSAASTPAAPMRSPTSSPRCWPTEGCRMPARCPPTTAGCRTCTCPSPPRCSPATSTPQHCCTGTARSTPGTPARSPSGPVPDQAPVPTAPTSTVARAAVLRHVLPRPCPVAPGVLVSLAVPVPSQARPDVGTPSAGTGTAPAGWHERARLGRLAARAQRWRRPQVHDLHAHRGRARPGLHRRLCPLPPPPVPGRRARPDLPVPDLPGSGMALPARPHRPVRRHPARLGADRGDQSPRPVHPHHQVKTAAVFAVERDPRTGITTWRAPTGHVYTLAPEHTDYTALGHHLRDDYAMTIVIEEPAPSTAKTPVRPLTVPASAAVDPDAHRWLPESTAPVAEQHARLEKRTRDPARASDWPDEPPF